MAQPFQASRAKLRRAELHRETLEPEIKSFVGSQPIELRSETNLAGTDDPIRCGYFVVKVDPTPAHWPLVAGDAIQNMRAALDYAVWALVIAKKGAAFAYTHRHRIDFPVADKAPNFPVKRLEQIGLSRAAIDVIEAAQPYHAPYGSAREHPLWYIAALSNIDKHRLLHVISVVGEEAAVRSSPYLRDAKVVFMTKGALRKGAEVVRFTATRPLARTEVSVTFTFTAGISFEATPETQAVGIDLVLRAMRDTATSIIDDLSVAVRPARRRPR